MARHTPPTELELVLLKILWEHGPLLTEQVREYLAQSADSRDLAYSSVITMLNILVKKGLARRTKQGRAFVFEAAVDEKEITQKMLGDLADRLFEGSRSALMLELLDVSELSHEELTQIQKMITAKKKELS